MPLLFAANNKNKKTVCYLAKKPLHCPNQPLGIGNTKVQISPPLHRGYNLLPNPSLQTACHFDRIHLNILEYNKKNTRYLNQALNMIVQLCKLYIKNLHFCRIAHGARYLTKNVSRCILWNTRKKSALAAHCSPVAKENCSGRHALTQRAQDGNTVDQTSIAMGGTQQRSFFRAARREGEEPVT